ncbi:MAG: site-specific DNA-methyltransferase [Candidatus Heimdallarchaeota archaeon]|nr:site-specific DNA-methyltransferase [Candidatus Heimdallarchaeota archaeon]MCG3256558.1 site-specific DNA-methyltransferase [Candidatus Heimdallarchaeota archaeon]MCK4611622.1 site-specific DNA-methyltransferase [Candidatus Heimdallarchaeota archaeon]
MKTIITLSKVQRREIPERFRRDDNRFSETLVEYFLEEYTRKGDIVLDVFAGLGTTLFVAEDMERIPYGIEYDEQKCKYIRENLEHEENIINGDTLKLLEYNIPKCDFCLTSPPYMPKDDVENPFIAFSTQGSYEQYLLDYGIIYKQVKQVMKPNSTIVVELSNIKNQGEVTTLAWDVAKEISKVLHFEGEIVIKWENASTETNDGIYGYGYDHSYCLVFRNI